MPTPTAAERLHALQQKNRKAAGLPDPSEYKKKLDSMKKENYEEDDGPLSQEQLDEISSQLKASYVSGAKKQIKQSIPFTKKTDEYRDIAKNFIAKRQKGIAKANEEVEQLDELSKETLKSYIGKSTKDMVERKRQQKIETDRANFRTRHAFAKQRNHAYAARIGDEAKKRAAGIGKAAMKIATKNEEVELLDEMPESSMKTRDVHSHLKKSGWELARSKGGHDVYKHPKAKHSIPVPRHNQLKAPLIRGIMKASKVEEQLEKKGRFVSGPTKQPYKSNTIVTAVKEGVTIGGLVGRGNIYQYDRNPGPKDGSELEHVPFHAKTEKQKKLQKALTDLGNKMKQTHPKLREAKDSQEYDYEGDMAKSDLRSIIHNAQTLHDMLDDNTNLAEWCQSKITLAEDYISTVTNYMRSEMNEEVEQIDELSKGTLGSYIKKARFSGEHHNWRANVARAKQDQNISMKKHDNRIKGIDKAVDRLTKEEVVQEDKNDYQRKIEKNNKKFIAASKRQKNPLTNVHTAQTKQKPVKEDVELNEQGLHSVRDLHLSKDDYLRKYTPKKSQDDDKKKQPQGADFAAQRRKERLAKSGRMDEKKNLPGLWANIHAKRKRGEPPAKPGDKDYPKTLNIESAAEPTEGEMKGKQGYSRKAQIVMNAAKGKKSDSPDKFQKDPELSSEIHKT